MPEADASGEAPVVVLAAEVPEGKVLDESMLAVARLPRARVSASFIPADRLRDVVGARTVVPLQPKDALMWQMLDDADQPQRAVSCMMAVAPGSRWGVRGSSSCHTAAEAALSPSRLAGARRQEQALRALIRT